MAVWQENMKNCLDRKEVVLVHGNIRDSAYIRQDGGLIGGLPDLVRQVGRELDFQRIVFWGVSLDEKNQAHTPMWSLQRIESLTDDAAVDVENRDTGAKDRKIITLSRWLEEDIRDVLQKTLFVINYVDKLAAYSQHGNYSGETGEIVLLLEKIIENIAPNNRLLMIALQDTMLPMEFYTNSPRVAVMEIPMPDRSERAEFFTRHLATVGLSGRDVELLANITAGMYVRDLENITRDVLALNSDTEKLTPAAIRKSVNRYRIGSEEDPWAQLPLSGAPKGLIDSAEQWFTKRVIGQDHAVTGVVGAIKKARAAVTALASGQEAKPKAVFFFAGPTGVGKTFLAKQLAEYLFDTQEAFLRFDMSEFKEEHTVSKLIGAPPGYVGYEKGGMLTNGIRTHPFSVILFDEIEKAHPKIMDIFLQILDDGRLTDSRGQTVFFTESVIVFTSNIGTRAATGTNDDEQARLEQIFQQPGDHEIRQEQVRRHFIDAVHNFFVTEISRPELLNRIGSQIIGFNFLDSDRVQENIFAEKLRQMSTAFRDKFSNHGYRLVFSDEIVEYFMNKYGDSIKKFGGRGVVNSLDDEVGLLIAEQKLWSEEQGLDDVIFTVSVDNGELTCRTNS